MNEGDPEDVPPVRVPAESLSREALSGLVEAFVLREGTDYGHADYSLEEKVSEVCRQLERGEAEIMFDPHTGTVTIVRLDAHSTPRSRA